MFVCPRCGDLGYISVKNVNGKPYYYVRHEVRAGRSRKVRYCYIGPVEGYQHAESIHRLMLTNILEQDYLMTALAAVERAVLQIEKSVEKSRKASEEFKQRIREAKERVLEVYRKLEEIERLVSESS
jgi:hypothetical protein